MAYAPGRHGVDALLEKLRGESLPTGNAHQLGHGSRPFKLSDRGGFLEIMDEQAFFGQAVLAGHCQSAKQLHVIADGIDLRRAGSPPKNDPVVDMPRCSCQSVTARKLAEYISDTRSNQSHRALAKRPSSSWSSIKGIHSRISRPVSFLISFAQRVGPSQLPAVVAFIIDKVAGNGFSQPIAKSFGVGFQGEVDEGLRQPRIDGIGLSAVDARVEILVEGVNPP